MGNGTTYDYNTTGPAQIATLSNVAAIACGRNFGLALLQNGTVMSWGENISGQLGIGNLTQQNIPVAIPSASLSNVKAVSGGYQFSLALKNDGTVWAWGDNSYGQLGNNTYTGISTPAQVPGLTNIIAIATGGYHCLALASNGTVWAWGNNADGELGNGSTTNSPVPLQIASLSGVTSIAAGYEHSLAVKSNGSLWAWGGNPDGQLGDGTTTDSYVPIMIDNLASAIFSGSLSDNTFILGFPLPTITSFTPTIGGTGTAVTISGTNLTGTTAVAIGGTAASITPPTTSATTVTATVGSGSSGTITLTSPGGSATSSGTFTFVPAPTISGFTFTSGSGGAGSVVSITGTNFSGTGYTTTAVAFGGTPAAAFTAVSATSITATVGSGSNGAVTVTTPGGTASSSGTGSGTFTFIPAPTITSFTPTSGGAGTVVTISGTNLPGPTAVAFCGTPAASFTFNSTAGTISATLANGSSGTITVTTPGGTATSSSIFSYTSPYIYTVLTTLTPVTSATGGEELGMGFQSSANGQITQIRFYKPATETGPHTGNIWASTGGPALASVPFTGETASGWQYATLATPLTITPGTNYIVSVNSNTAYSTTLFGLESSIVNGPLASQIGWYNSTPGCWPSTVSQTDFFRDVVFVAAAPTITSFTPTVGGNGTVVTLTGTNFLDTSAVTVGGTAASFTVNNTGSINATVGSGSTGTISVTNLGGTATSSGTFTWVPVPTISGFTPANGGVGTVVTITGTNFTGTGYTTTVVKVGGTAASAFTVVSATTITATVGSGSFRVGHRHHPRRHRRQQRLHLGPGAHHFLVHPEWPE